MRHQWGVPQSFLTAVVAVFIVTTAIYYLQQPYSIRDPLSPEAAVRPPVEGRASAGGSSRGSGTTNTDNTRLAEVTAARAGSAVAGALPTAALHPPRRPSLTVACVSDTHGLFKRNGLIKVPEGDMLLFPGDMAVGSAAEGLAFAGWLEGLPIQGPRVITWGNMDTATPGLTDPVPGAQVVVNSIVEVRGYRIFGSPWTPRFAGAYQLSLDDDESYDYWSKLLPPNSDVDIIMTHGPPYGIADRTGGRHRGDKGLLRAVQALQRAPLLWVCGHIHEQFGPHRVPHPAAPSGDILLLNSAVYYLQQPGYGEEVQPRAVALPEAVVLPRA